MSIRDLAREVNDIATAMDAIEDELEADNYVWSHREIVRLKDRLDDIAWRLDERPCPRCNVRGEIGLRERLRGCGVDVQALDRRTLHMLTLAEQDSPGSLDMSPAEYERWKSTLPRCPECGHHTGDRGYVYPNMDPPPTEVARAA